PQYALHIPIPTQLTPDSTLFPYTTRFRSPYLSSNAVASTSRWTTCVEITISPTSNLLENPPAEPVLITRDGLKRSCKIVVVIAALTFPIPDFNNTTSTPDSFPFTNKLLATVTSC